MKRVEINGGYRLACRRVGLASMRPDDVAGLVLVDSSFEEESFLPDGLVYDGQEPLDPVLGARELRDVTPPRVPAAIVSQHPGNWEDQLYPEGAEAWGANQRRLADLLNATHYVCTHSSHHLHEEDPELIAVAVDDIVRRARTDEHH